MVDLEVNGKAKFLKQTATRDVSTPRLAGISKPWFPCKSWVQDRFFGFRA